MQHHQHNISYLIGMVNTIIRRFIIFDNFFFQIEYVVLVNISHITN